MYHIQLWTWAVRSRRRLAPLVRPWRGEGQWETQPLSRHATEHVSYSTGIGGGRKGAVLSSTTSELLRLQADSLGILGGELDGPRVNCSEGQLQCWPRLRVHSIAGCSCLML